MEQSNRILDLLSEGLRPLTIATACKTSIGLVTQELTKAIDGKRVQRSQVLATLDKQLQDQIAVYVPAWKKNPGTFSPQFIHTMLKDTNPDDFDLSIEEVRLYLLCFGKGFKSGQLYESLCEIERTLHTKIRLILIRKHGIEETGWWRKGVPEKVRLACVNLCETDADFSGNPPYSYTTLIHLKDIIEHNRTLFEHTLPVVPPSKKPDMKAVSSELAKLNKIRNKVMHPIGASPPTEEDFFFVNKMQATFDLTKWRCEDKERYGHEH
jgi:hypothetical protein